MWYQYTDIKIDASDIIENTMYRDVVDAEDGVVTGTEVTVGKEYYIQNKHNGIRIVDNFLRVAADSEGVYMVINKWHNVTDGQEMSTRDSFKASETLTQDDAYAALSSMDINSGSTCELVYKQIDNGTYKLHYEIISVGSDGQAEIFFVDAENGSVTIG